MRVRVLGGAEAKAFSNVKNEKRNVKTWAWSPVGCDLLDVTCLLPFFPARFVAKKLTCPESVSLRKKTRGA